MAMNGSGGPVRKFVTRLMVTGVLLAMCAVGAVALLTSGTGPAQADHWRGWRGEHQEWDAVREWRWRRPLVRNGYRYVCRHDWWSSIRRCYWVE